MASFPVAEEWGRSDLDEKHNRSYESLILCNQDLPWVSLPSVDLRTNVLTWSGSIPGGTTLSATGSLGETRPFSHSLTFVAPAEGSLLRV